jgi:hypothetical protein
MTVADLMGKPYAELSARDKLDPVARAGLLIRRKVLEQGFQVPIIVWRAFPYG